jgi:ligand-binding sensor domain-containing protein
LINFDVIKSLSDKMSILPKSQKYIASPGLLVMILVSFISCKKTDVPASEDVQLIRKEDTLKIYQTEIRFDITGRLLEGKRVDCIEPDYKGSTWVAGGKELYHFKNGIEKNIPLDFEILDISVAGDESLWIATNGGGLGHLEEDGITWYTKQNSGLPRDYISNVEVGLDGRVWFSSCAHDYGGLVVYDGKKFDLYNPDNSILNQHVIADISIDHSGAVYVMTLSTVNKTNIYCISGDNWKCLRNEKGTFYWVTVVTAGPSGTVYLLEDFMLSSSTADTNKLHVYTDNEWKRLKPDFMNSRLSFFTAIKADRREYCWIASIEGNSYILHAYDGKEWKTAPAQLFGGDKITTVKTDFDNNIWIGTAHNGVFILEQ